MANGLFGIKETAMELYNSYIGRLKEEHGDPLLNESYYQTSQFTGLYRNQPYDYKQLMVEFKKSPEAVGIINYIKTDILSDGYRFNGKKLNVKKATEFCKQNMFKTELGATMIDWLVLGDGALWLGKLNPSDLSKITDKIKQEKPQLKDYDFKQIYDEDYSSAKVIKNIPWSTMNIIYDSEKVSGFKQIVNNKLRVWKTDEIIHAMFMKVDGKVYGFSPFIASQNVVTTLSLIKDLNGNFFQNGGVPDWMFIFPKEMAGNPNVEKLRQILKEKRMSQNKHGSLVFTGELNPIQLNKFDKDMEYRDMAKFYAGLLALAFNMPSSRISSLLGGSGGKSDDLTDAAYWRSISSAQDYWEDLLNTQLFEPYFDVEIEFNRSYKQDEIREAQRDQFKVDFVHKLIGDLKIPVKKEWLLQELGLEEDDVDDFNVQDLIEKIGESGLERKNNLKNSELTGQDGTVESSKRKKTTMNQKPESPNL